MNNSWTKKNSEKILKNENEKYKQSHKNDDGELLTNKASPTSFSISQYFTLNEMILISLFLNNGQKTLIKFRYKSEFLDAQSPTIGTRITKTRQGQNIPHSQSILVSQDSLISSVHDTAFGLNLQLCSPHLFPFFLVGETQGIQNTLKLNTQHFENCFQTFSR